MQRSDINLNRLVILTILFLSNVAVLVVLVILWFCLSNLSDLVPWYLQTAQSVITAYN